MTPDDGFFSTPEMIAAFSSEAHVRQMLAFEAALARAQARAGIIPSEAAEAIAAACRVETFDIASLYREAALAGTVAIPLVRMLTERVDGDAKRYVHWGATSQDAIDTALVMQMREGLDHILGNLLPVAAVCASLAERHRRTPMVGRTLLQQALPITFGLKAARWLGMLTRQVGRLRELRKRALVVQFGGAAGTLASLGDQGLRVSELLADELGLTVPDLPWHAERDRIAEVAAALGVLAGGMAKIATDVLLLRQTEVGELSEVVVPGKGGSSAMPHKRNPVDATMALASARLAIGTVPVVLGAMAQEHERAAGGWQAEWEALPNLFRYTASTVSRVREALEGTVVHPERMRANLELTGGSVMAEALTTALAVHLGRPEAFRLVQTMTERGLAEGTDLHTIAVADERVRSVLPTEAIDRAFDPRAYLGSTERFIDRAIASYRSVLPSTNGE
ncbi:MAG: 3-carboxy-cis,cis-muconate cycloisomerase [Thermomicrobiales bacterium]|jgi:3-carboxy-cis,cis-muconate cycloisomerase|nr:3-carboxy-cis,cis-muconate cycloisomerase [Thermomicrobiales bacterium]